MQRDKAQNQNSKKKILIYSQNLGLHPCGRGPKVPGQLLRGGARGSFLLLFYSRGFSSLLQMKALGCSLWHSPWIYRTVKGEEGLDWKGFALMGTPENYFGFSTYPKSGVKCWNTSQLLTSSRADPMFAEVLGSPESSKIQQNPAWRVFRDLQGLGLASGDKGLEPKLLSSCCISGHTYKVCMQRFLEIGWRASSKITHQAGLGKSFHPEQLSEHSVT